LATRRVRARAALGRRAAFIADNEWRTNRTMSMPRDLARTVLLCLVGGSADAISYLRYGTFVGAMSGNTVLLGIDIVERRPERVLYHVSIVAAFLAAAILARVVITSRIPVIVPLAATAAMLGLSELITDKWGALLSAAALGLQNATVHKIGGVWINTVFITGNLMQLASAVPQTAVPRQHREITLLTTAWLAYAAGAVLGGAALHLISYPMIVPAVLAFVAAVVEEYVKSRDATLAG
jgi:uncharacterized membrane protein YoaK (UPF0700 family)